MHELQEFSIVILNSTREAQRKCWVHSGRGAHFHLGSWGWGPGQLRGEGALVIALSSDLTQPIVYSSARVLSKLDCNCLFMCLSLQLDLEPWEGKGHALFKSPFPGPDSLCTQKGLRKALLKEQHFDFLHKKGGDSFHPEKQRIEISVCVLGPSPQLDCQLL